MPDDDAAHGRRDHLGDLAAQLFLRAQTRFQILQWLAPLEALARRLLVIEALALPPPNARPPRAPVRDTRIVSALADASPAEEAGDPETWRVVFNLWPGAKAGGRRRADVELRDAQGEARMLRNALPLARRIEALRRLAENPEQALRRMAALLAARRGQVAERFSAYAPRNRLRACPAARLLAGAQAQLAAALATDTS